MNNIADVADEFEGELRGRVEQTLEKIKEQIVRSTVDVIDEQYEQRGALVATGQLRKMITGEVEQSGDKYIVSVYPAVEYGAAANNGTPPHKVAVDVIARWITRKKLSGKWREGGGGFAPAMKRKGSIGKMSEEQETMAAARAISRKIARKGTKGYPFMDQGLERAIPQIEQTIREL